MKHPPDTQLLADVIDLLRAEEEKGRRTLDLDEDVLATLDGISKPDAKPRVRSPGPEPAHGPGPSPGRPHHASRATPAAPSPDSTAISEMTWDQLEAAVSKCRKCPLAKSRTRTVFGEGARDADLMFIGEGPGMEEDRQGRPFVGPAGHLLTRMIEAMQFRREDVYIANIVKCHPPGNRNPATAEAKQCLPYLYRQIELVKPKVIVLLGAVPLDFLMNQSGIMHWHGKWQEFRGIPVMPTFHPAFILRSRDFRKPLWQDLQAVMRRFGKDPAESVRKARERRKKGDRPGSG